MNEPNTILATDKNGEPITAGQVNEWLTNINDDSQRNLANFFYDRFYGRYLKPFDFPNTEYQKKYKSGFAIMTSCCLLIETFISFTVIELVDTNTHSERCFGYFFNKYADFNVFSTDGLDLHDYENLKLGMHNNNSGLPQDFYRHVRCGILHNGETKNGWRIRRNISQIFDPNTKTIDAYIFMDKLKKVIDNFRNDLIESDFNTDQIWIAYKARLEELIDNT